MTLSPRQRWLVIGGALVITLGLTFWLGGEPDEEPASAPAARAPAEARPPAPAARAAPAPAAGSLRLTRGDKAEPQGEVRDLFGAQTWRVPPPEKPPGPPQPPPLPFTYLGKLVEDGRVTVYLVNQERNIAVREGDVIDGTYKVRRIRPPTMTFVYLPMNKQQSLEIGRAN